MMFRGWPLLLSLAALNAGKTLVTYNAGGADWATSAFQGGEIRGATVNNSLCSAGKTQSPVNIVYNFTRYDSKLKPVNASYEQPRSFNLTLSDYAINIIWDDGLKTDGITQGGIFFPLRSLHLHSPSEHTFNGQNFPLEMHLVHQHAATGKVIAVAVLFHTHPREQDNSFLARFLRRVPTTVGGSTRINNTGVYLDIAVDILGSDIYPGRRAPSSRFPFFSAGARSHAAAQHAEERAPASARPSRPAEGPAARPFSPPWTPSRMLRNYFTYNGSLTTPPCTEGTTWYVLRKTQAVSTRQVMNITAVMSSVMGGRGRAGNARPTQPINGRVVYTTKAPAVKFDLQSASSFEALLEGEVNIDAKAAHKLAEAVAGLTVVLMLFVCFFCISMGFVFIQRQELHKLRRGAVDPLAAAGAVAAAVGASGEPMPPGSRASQVTGLGGMIQLGRKDKHGDKEMLL